MESMQNVYHVTRQNFHFVQAAYWELRSGIAIFDSDIIFSGLDWRRLLPMVKNILGKQIIALIINK